MAEFVIRLADDRGRVQEQTHAAATAEELRAKFLQAGYYVYSVKARGVMGGASKTKKVKLETFLVFNQQFLTLVRAGLPILGSLELLGAAAEGSALSGAAGGCGGAGEDGRVDLRGVRGAGWVSAGVYDDAAGG